MGSLEMVHGDLFTADTDAIAHGCNCQGKMGAGIAGVVRKREPAMFREYEVLCASRMFSVGSVFLWTETNSDRTLYNLGTQVQPGRTASRFAINLALQNMADVMWRRQEHSVGLPLIGCGIGGLSWHTHVLPLVQNLAQRVNVKVYYLDPKDLN